MEDLAHDDVAVATLFIYRGMTTAGGDPLEAVSAAMMATENAGGEVGAAYELARLGELAEKLTATAISVAGDPPGVVGYDVLDQFGQAIGHELAVTGVLPSREQLRDGLELALAGYFAGHAGAAEILVALRAA